MGARQGIAALVALGAVAGASAGATADATTAGATTAGNPACGTVTVTWAGHSKHSVTIHRCERLKVVFNDCTQCTPLYLWQVTRKPTRVLRLLSHGFHNPDPNDSNTTQQIWLYDGRRQGDTTIRFADTNPDPTLGPAATFKLSVRVK